MRGSPSSEVSASTHVVVERSGGSQGVSIAGKLEAAIASRRYVGRADLYPTLA